MNVYALNIYSERVSSYELKSISGRSALNRLSIARKQNGNYSGTNSANRKKTRNKSTSALAGNLRNLSDDALLARLEALRGKERKIQLDILIFISEVEKRKLYLQRAYNSLC